MLPCARRCDVFAFDPTVSYYTSALHTHGVTLERVTFFSWGLTSSEDGSPYAEVASLGAQNQYGAVTGALYSLPQIVTMLGHQGRTITALKLDCEGCEFAAFRDLWCEEQLQQHTHMSPSPPVRIASLVMEVHLIYSENLPRLATSADVERIRYLGLWLQLHGYTAFQHATHEGMISHYRGGIRALPPDIEAAGVDPFICCYLVGFVREDLVGRAIE